MLGFDKVNEDPKPFDVRAEVDGEFGTVGFSLRRCINSIIAGKIVGNLVTDEEIKKQKQKMDQRMEKILKVHHKN